MKTVRQDIKLQKPRSASTAPKTSRDIYKNICKKLRAPMNPGILESLITNEIEVCFDDITSEQLPSFQSVLKSIRLKSIKLWSNSYETNEFTKLGIRKTKSRTESKVNTESLAIMSIQFSSISESIEKSRILKELGLYGIILTVKTWGRLSSSLESSQITTLSFQKCEISEKELDAIFQPIGSMTKLTYLDLSNNNLIGNCGYLIGRIISKQGERRDTNKWENELRGSIADFPTGLCEIYISNNHIGDYGWEKIISALVSDNWLMLIEAQNIDLTMSSYKNTIAAIDSNKSILVLDLRGNNNFDLGFRKILDVVFENFKYADRNNPNNEKYINLFQKVCNGENIPKVCEIKAVTKAKMKNTTGNMLVRNTDSKGFDRKNNSMNDFKISQECEVIKEENAKLRKKIKKGGKKKKRLVSTQNILRFAD
ncbi:hypothetical protein SteCoe_31236 [Stentor coeruleus]|uniref:Uncharacterized protein n=1 Tax=Stentor coeruleus TaxID=5963 RepID=A0A1R2B1Q7_9CILI|nr:hypothetical protein SteCoe_31236 [Stentor coeruleus]